MQTPTPRYTPSLANLRRRHRCYFMCGARLTWVLSVRAKTFWRLQLTRLRWESLTSPGASRTCSGRVRICRYLFVVSVEKWTGCWAEDTTGVFTGERDRTIAYLSRGECVIEPCSDPTLAHNRNIDPHICRRVGTATIITSERRKRKTTGTNHKYAVIF